MLALSLSWLAIRGAPLMGPISSYQGAPAKWAVMELRSAGVHGVLFGEVQFESWKIRIDTPTLKVTPSPVVQVPAWARVPENPPGFLQCISIRSGWPMHCLEGHAKCQNPGVSAAANPPGRVIVPATGIELDGAVWTDQASGDLITAVRPVRILPLGLAINTLTVMPVVFLATLLIGRAVVRALSIGGPK